MAKDSKATITAQGSKDHAPSKVATKVAEKPVEKAKQATPEKPKAAEALKSAAKPGRTLLNVKAVYRDTVHPGTAQMIFANRWTPVDGSNQWIKNMLASGMFIQE